MASYCSTNNAQNNKDSRVQISLYASKLKNVAGFGRKTPNPYAVVTMVAGGPQEKPNVLGKTEVIPNTLNPEWTHLFETEYKFGKEAKFIVGIFDDVGTSGKENSMGNAAFELGEVLAARGSVAAKQLKDGGTIYVRVTRAIGPKGGNVQGKLRGVKLTNVDGILGKSDPFYTISSQINSASGRTWQPVYRSETVNNNLDPVWDSFALPLDKMCGGNKDLPLLIEVSDWEKSGKHKTIGSVETTLNGLVFLMGSSDRKLPLIHKNKSRGSLQLESLHISDEGAPAVESNIQPKKFIKVNGINKLNPEYQKWKDAHTAQP